MKFITVCISLLAVFSTALAAFQHDANAPDGVYSHFIDADGVAQNVYLGPLKTRSRRRFHLAREDQGVQCQTDVPMNSDDADAADNVLAEIFGDGMLFFKSISAKSGSAVAYGCDYGKGQSMNHDQFLDYMADIATECGTGSAGFFRDVGSKSSYGRTNAGISFC